jgi:hypothetical protein
MDRMIAGSPVPVTARQKPGCPVQVILLLFDEDQIQDVSFGRDAAALAAEDLVQEPFLAGDQELVVPVRGLA